jgi:hypothetical protein
MLIFGMGLYELFVSTLEVAGEEAEGVRTPARGSNIFGLFHLRVHMTYIFPRVQVEKLCMENS